VWLTSTPAEEAAANTTRIGAPLVVGGVVVGILGVVKPANKAELDHGGNVALVADLASAALQRLGSGRS
jgi:hypothetical protein